MSGGILPLTDETIVSNADAKDTSQQALLQDRNKKSIRLCMMTLPIQKMRLIVYDNFEEELIKKSSNKNKRRFGTIRARCR